MTIAVAARADADPPAPNLTTRDFRGDVDGLRAVAIVLVVAYHALVLGSTAGSSGSTCSS